MNLGVFNILKIPQIDARTPTKIVYLRLTIAITRKAVLKTVSAKYIGGMLVVCLGF